MQLVADLLHEAAAALDAAQAEGRQEAQTSLASLAWLELQEAVADYMAYLAGNKPLTSDEWALVKERVVTAARHAVNEAQDASTPPEAVEPGSNRLSFSERREAQAEALEQAAENIETHPGPKSVTRAGVVFGLRARASALRTQDTERTALAPRGDTTDTPGKG